MKQAYDISLIIQLPDGQLMKDKATEPRESSSTIKIPILLLAVKKMAASNQKLSDNLKRLPHHNTKGSGILNWTSAENFSFSDLLSTTLIYSDCLATNILIDYVGGRRAINKWLASQGYQTKMAMEYLIFDGSDARMPHVGTTTAQEMMEIFKKFDTEPLPADIRGLINRSASNVHESWLQTSLISVLDNLRHKTGSMINCGPDGQTVYNAAGTFKRRSGAYYFCLLSSGRLSKHPSDQKLDPMRQYVAGYFDQALKNLA
jgi:hypothetical protein